MVDQQKVTYIVNIILLIPNLWYERHINKMGPVDMCDYKGVSLGEDVLHILSHKVLTYVSKSTIYKSEFLLTGFILNAGYLFIYSGQSTTDA